MNKITRINSRGTLLKLALIYFSFLFFQVNLSAQDGEKLFKTSCTACHKLTSDRLVGPGLAGVTEKRSKEWLMGFIKNSQEMIANGDKDAVAIFEEYNKVPMPAHPFSDEELAAIIDYMANPEASSEKKEEPKEAATADADAEVDPLVLEGQKLFKNNCKACHSVGTDKVVGPGLQGISDKRSHEWLVKWIQNSADLIASGDPQAVAIFEEYNKVPMPAQPVSKEDIKAILAYIANPPVDKKAAATEEVVATTEDDSSMVTFIVLAVICVSLFIVILMLNKSRAMIAKANAEKAGTEYTGPVSLIAAFKHTLSNNKGYVAAVVVILVFAGLVDLMGVLQLLGFIKDISLSNQLNFLIKFTLEMIK